MLSYVHGASDVELLGETIGACLDRIAASHADHEALVSVAQNLRYTYQQLHREADRVARGLMALGVKRGDRVGIWSANRAEWMLTQYGAAKAGAILVNVNPAYRLRELEFALRQSGVSLLISARNFRATDYVAMLDQVAPTLPDLKTLVYLGSGGARAIASTEVIKWADLLAASTRVPEEQLRQREAALQCDDAVNIQYTSGTTGNPKGATLSHHNILNNGYFVAERQKFTAAD